MDKFKFVKVISSEIYAIEQEHYPNQTIEQITERWFKDPSSAHAGRDGSKVGNSKKILNIELIDDISKERGKS